MVHITHTTYQGRDLNSRQDPKSRHREHDRTTTSGKLRKQDLETLPKVCETLDFSERYYPVIHH